MNYVIGVDIGTQSAKALLVAADGAIVAKASQSYQVDTPRPLWAEQWPDVWLQAVYKTAAECVATSGVDPASVRGICVSSLYGGSGIPVDADIKPLHPCLIWMDRRATAETEWVREHVDVARLQEITGNGVDSYYGYTKILWLKANKPEVWRQTRYLLPPNSYVNYHLTGELAVDHSSAGNIGGVYDLQRRQWSQEAMDMLGIEANKMPERLAASGEIVGRLTAEAGARLGLPADIPVVAGGVDAAMATLAAGVVEPGNHVAMIGTSMCWGFVNRETDARNGLISMPYVANSEQDIYIFGGAITAGASISWFREQFCEQDRQAAQAQGEADVHQLMERDAAKTPPGANGLVFLPYLMGERSPIWDPNASGSFVGLTLYHTRAHLYRSILEGLAFALRHNIECGRQGAARLDPELIVVGGAARSDLWMQIIADVTGYPVLTIEQDVEAPIGAALLAALAGGLVEEVSAIRNWISLAPRARPIAANAAVYERMFQQYCRLYPKLRNAMHDLRAVAQEKE
ncbi:FGGY-family carbohydrate kinase [Hahella sp. NBU794]|uniref:FGGY-family carbohydrate kinase n=1 Tax=Hahella sp. NBU794 TaxID=3422590 RepID=UPI003D6DE2AF